MTVSSDDVLAGLQQLLQLAVQLQGDTLAPDLTSAGNLCAVDVDLENVVVRVDQRQVLVQVLGVDVDGATHVEVAILVAPTCANVAEVF